MKKRLKKLPKFKNEDEEREFWDTHDSPLIILTGQKPKT